MTSSLDNFSVRRSGDLFFFSAYKFLMNSEVGLQDLILLFGGNFSSVSFSTWI